MKIMKSLFFVLFTLFVFVNNIISQTYLEKDLKSLIKEKSHPVIDGFIFRQDCK